MTQDRTVEISLFYINTTQDEFLEIWKKSQHAADRFRITLRKVNRPDAILPAQLKGTQLRVGHIANIERAQATQRVQVAQLKSAQAQLETAQINRDYTEIHSPIDGRIGRTSVTIGNVVSPASGTLTTVVSQDPMYVVFPVPTRRAIELREEYSKKGGFDAVKIRLRLPDGRIYAQTGKVDFINNAIAQDTDTLTVRGVVPNAVLGAETAGGVKLRELVADEFVTVLLESVMPREVIAVPRAAILSDQEGSYVYVVDDHNTARQRRVRLGQVTPETAGIADGLKEGEQVIVEGVQRARPNAPVTPAPVTSIASRG